jgi:hypothetical protein
MAMTTSSNIATAVALAMASTAAQAAPRDLDTAALDAVAAGAAPSDPSPDTGSTSVIVADQSELELHQIETVSLRDTAQRQAAAVNIVNAAGADVISAANIATDLGGRVLARQLNEVFQVEHSYGHVERISLAGPNLSRSHSSSSAFASSSSSSSTRASLLQSRTSHSVQDSYNASVPAYFPLQNMTLTLGTADLPSVTVPAFSFDLTTTDDVGGVYGIRGGLGPFTFDPPQIVLGTVSFQGDDLVVAGGFVDLPSLDLGSATIDFCVVDCGGVSVDLPTIDGPRIDLPGEWRFEGANPFKDVRINAGNGIAAAGSGHVSLSAAHVTLGAELSLDLPDLTTSFSFDVLGFEVSTPEFGVEIPAISASITVVDADIGPGYDADFDGTLCLAVQTTDCGRLEHSESSQSTVVDIRQTSASASAARTESGSSSGEESVTAGATLTGADAELIAMSEGRAQIEQGSVVELGAQAQRGMQVVNAVNASGAIVGNALNVGTQRAATTTSTGVSQSNSFTQYKTRPRP